VEILQLSLPPGFFHHFLLFVAEHLAFIIHECFIVVPLSHQQKQLVERVVGRCLFCGADTLCIESPKHGIIVNHLGIDSANQEVKQTLHQTACNILLISAGP